MRPPSSGQVEAYSLMLYRSESGREFRIWNTRDGVTPFTCRIDDEEFKHVEWRQDKRTPDFVPKVGMYVFVDLTIEKAVEYRTKYVDRAWNNPDYPMETEGQWKDKHDAIWDLARGDLVHGGGAGPDLVKITAEWVAGFVAGQRNMAGPLPEPVDLMPEGASDGG